MFYDVVHDRAIPADQRSAFRRDLAECQIVDAQACVSVLRSGQITFREVSDCLTELPDPIPPFEKVWCEYAVPADRLFTVPNGEAMLVRVGCFLAISARPDHSKSDQNLIIGGSAFFEMCGETVPLAATFLMRSNGRSWRLVRFGRDVACEPGERQQFLYRLAQLMTGGAMSNVKFKDGGMIEEWDRIVSVVLSPIESPGPATQHLFFLPAFWAFSLCHCKNIGVETESMDPNLLRKRIKTGRPYVEKTVRIVVQGNAKKGETGAVSDNEGLLMPHHIVRGHFKDYSKHGLFGNCKGVYWWQSHARGDIQSGKIQHIYEPRPGPGEDSS